MGRAALPKIIASISSSIEGCSGFIKAASNKPGVTPASRPPSDEYNTSGSDGAVAQLADCLRQRQAIHARHLQIGDDEIERIAASNPFQRRVRRGRIARQHAPRFDLQRQDAPIGVVVVDDQQPLAVQLHWRSVELNVRLKVGRGFSQNRKVERRANTDFALDPHRAAHELAQALADDQPQARAAIFARSRGINLAKRLEEPIEAIGRDADARITHGKMDRLLVVRGPIGWWHRPLIRSRRAP